TARRARAARAERGRRCRTGRASSSRPATAATPSSRAAGRSSPWVLLLSQDHQFVGFFLVLRRVEGVLTLVRGYPAGARLQAPHSSDCCLQWCRITRRLAQVYHPRVL